MKRRFGIVKDKCMAWIMIFTMVLSLVSGLDITPVKADNKIRIQLPEALDFSKETGDVYSGGVIIGSYVIEKNYLVITKSDDEAWNNNVAGQFQIDGTINPDSAV